MDRRDISVRGDDLTESRLEREKGEALKARLFYLLITTSLLLVEPSLAEEAGEPLVG